jgi:hypothetical protein
MWPLPSIISSFTEKLNIQQIEKGEAMSILKYSFPGSFPNIKAIPVTKAEKKKYI